MVAQPNRQFESLSYPEAAVLAFRTEHDINWDQLTATDAPAVREALITASLLREVGRPQDAIDQLAELAVERLTDAA